MYLYDKCINWTLDGGFGISDARAQMASGAWTRARGWAPNGFRQISDRVMAWKGTLLGWELFAGAAVLLIIERIPAFRRDFFCKLPLIGDRYADYRVHEEEVLVDE